MNKMKWVILQKIRYFLVFLIFKIFFNKFSIENLLFWKNISIEKIVLQCIFVKINMNLWNRFYKNVIRLCLRKTQMTFETRYYIKREIFVCYFPNLKIQFRLHFSVTAPESYQKIIKKTALNKKKIWNTCFLF